MLGFQSLQEDLHVLGYIITTFGIHKETHDSTMYTELTGHYYIELKNLDNWNSEHFKVISRYGPCVHWKRTGKSRGHVRRHGAVLKFLPNADRYFSSEISVSWRHQFPRNHIPRNETHMDRDRLAPRRRQVNRPRRLNGVAATKAPPQRTWGNNQHEPVHEGNYTRS